MITKLYQEIAAGLNKIKTCKVYSDSVPETMELPAFLITISEQNPTNGINNCIKNTVGIDLMYFPESKEKLQEECWLIGQEMNRHFRILNFKIKNRNLKILDDVLHYKFEVSYQEILNESLPPMQELYQNTGIKED